MVAPSQGHFGTTSPAEARANFAGVNLPAPKRGQPLKNIDESLEANPDRMLSVEAYMTWVTDCAAQHPFECQFLPQVLEHYLKGRPVSAIAKEMNVTYSTAHKRINRTIEFIGERLREQEHAP